MGEEVPSLEMKLKVGAVFFWYNSNDLNGDKDMNCSENVNLPHC